MKQYVIISNHRLGDINADVDGEKYLARQKMDQIGFIRRNV